METFFRKAFCLGFGAGRGFFYSYIIVREVVLEVFFMVYVGKLRYRAVGVLFRVL